MKILNTRFLFTIIIISPHEGRAVSFYYSPHEGRAVSFYTAQDLFRLERRTDDALALAPSLLRLRFFFFAASSTICFLSLAV
jgi:hypothetical protein